MIAELIYLIDISVLALSFIDEGFVIRNYLLYIVLSRLYRLRLTDNKFILNIIYIALLKYALKDYIKEI